MPMAGVEPARGVNHTRFWVWHVYQFHHIGIKFIKFSKFCFCDEIGSLFWVRLPSHALSGAPRSPSHHIGIKSIKFSKFCFCDEIGSLFWIKLPSYAPSGNPSVAKSSRRHNLLNFQESLFFSGLSFWYLPCVYNIKKKYYFNINFYFFYIVFPFYFKGQFIFS